MKTGIIKKSDLIYKNREKITNVIMNIIYGLLLVLNTITLKKYDTAFGSFYCKLVMKKYEFIIKK